MMYGSEEHVEKWAVEVEVTLDNENRMLGFLFISPMRRISDLLNDERKFIPFRNHDGRIILLRKIAINAVSEIEQNIDEKTILDPFETLSVSRDINDDDLKDAFHRQCSQNHPDKLISLDVAPEIVNFANARLIRIIDAYQQIIKLRNSDQKRADGAVFTSKVFK